MKKAGAYFKRFLAVFAFLLVSVLGFAVGIGFWVYLYPHQAWQFAEKHFLPSDIKIEWQDAHASLRHVEKMNWDIQFSFAGLSIEKKSPQISMLLDRVALTANATLFSPRTEVYIKDFEIKSATPILIKTVPDPQAVEDPFDPTTTLHRMTSLLSTLRNYQERIKIDTVDIRIDDFRFISGGSKPILAAVQFTKLKAEKTRISINADVRNAIETVPQIKLQGAIDLADFDSAKPFVVATVNLNGPTLRASLPLSFVYQNERLTADTKLEAAYRLQSGWLSLNPVLQLRADKKNIGLQLAGEISGIPGPISKLRNLKIVYDLPLDRDENWLQSKGHVIATAPIPLFFVNTNMKHKIEDSCKCKLISSAGAKIEADVWLERLLGASENAKPAISADIRVQSISNAIFSVSLGATLDITHKTKTWLFEPTLDSKAHIESFKEVREILRASRILVPAPFSVLDGKIDFSAKSPIEIQKASGQISAQAKLSADLKSLRQSVNVETVLSMGLSADFKKIDVNVDAKVHDLQLELPPLDPLKGLPRLVRDTRIELKPVVVSREPEIKLLLSFKIQTTKKAAIRLLYPLADPYIPISINYDRVGKEEKGAIVIEPFTIKYLKREVYVDSLKLKLDETADADFPIDGHFHVNQTNYKVAIRVTGTTQKPNIDLSSDPYLERADIVSVLLFDRTRENLAGGDAEAAGNAQAAMADKAVGLFGLWAFASTPIRSVSYNSVTKVYSATIVLGQGLTAGIGTSLDNYTSFEIRKRLSKRWVIATSWAPSDTNENAGEVVLQWEKRY